jgi:phosphopantothenoylcysteine synthetase/decarboxylase
MTTNELLEREAATKPQHHGQEEEGRLQLFPRDETDSLRTQWQSVQGEFVDNPREAVQKADELVAHTISRLTEGFASERNRLEGDWARGGDVSTEDLRQALRRYRSLFDRLLSV